MGVLEDDADVEARRLEESERVEKLALAGTGDTWSTVGDMRFVRDGKVVEGRDGFLFMANDNNRVVDQHTGDLLLDEHQLEGWRATLERRRNWFAERDCAHLVMVVPNNHSLYPEMMPEGRTAAAVRPVHQLIAHLAHAGSPERIIYPLEEMMRGKADRLVASPVDSHWTDYGAFLAFRRLMEEAGRLIAVRQVGHRDVMFTDADVSGDLGSKFDPPRHRRQPVGRMRYRTARLMFDNCVEGTGSLAVTHCPPAPNVTCLLLGDSYAYWLARYMSECFRRLVFAHAPTLDRSLLEASQPDLAITVIAERFLVVVPNDERGRSMRAREERKREIDRIRVPLLHWTWPTLVAPSPVEALRSKLIVGGNLRDVALIGVMAYAGLRPAEAAALRWSAIKDETIVVEPLPRRREAGARARTVPLWAPLAEDLEAWRRESGGSGNKLVFTAPGQAWSVDLRVWRDEVYGQLTKEAGIEILPPNRLRHLYCMMMINGGASAKEVAALTDETPEGIRKTFRGLLEEAARHEPDQPEDVIRATRAVAPA